LPLHDYYRSGQTWHYFTNVVGLINYHLPGVFTHNPKSGVNWSLWTVPFELGCYAIMGCLMIFKLLRRPAVVVAMAVAFVVLGFSDLPVFSSGGAKLYIAFLLGIAGYLYRDRLPYSRLLFGGCVLFLGGLSLLRPAPWMSPALLNLIVGPVAVYVTIFIGHTKIPKIPVLNSGDYSYGIYLYGNPIQQAVRAALPWTNTAWLNLLVAVPLILAFAAVSWHGLEKPVLKFRRRFSFVARARGV
jgi:peptidoglycan/LPS O-acetylase OafA/YrhL